MGKQKADLTGQTIGKWTVLSYAGDYKWNCRCQCGTKKQVDHYTLIKGESTSCGCYKRDKWDITGQTINGLLAVKKVGRRSDNDRSPLYVFKCTCGKEFITTIHSVRTGHTNSCGCYHKKRTAEIATKHGKVHSRLYAIYKDMVRRCHCKTEQNYKNYGERGITVCDEWRNDFMAFYDWAYANGYDENAQRCACTLDRIDVNGNYEPSNCRWVSCLVQANNTRQNVRFMVRGENLTIAQIARKYNIRYQTLYYRLRVFGWDSERAITTPAQEYRKKGKKQVWDNLE